MIMLTEQEAKVIRDALMECASLIESELSGELDMTIPDPEPEEVEEILQQSDTALDILKTAMGTKK